MHWERRINSDFAEGNIANFLRTSRIHFCFKNTVKNAILIDGGKPPLSLRHVDPSNTFIPRLTPLITRSKRHPDPISRFATIHPPDRESDIGDKPVRIPAYALFYRQRATRLKTHCLLSKQYLVNVNGRLKVIYDAICCNLASSCRYRERLKFRTWSWWSIDSQKLQPIASRSVGNATRIQWRRASGSRGGGAPPLIFEFHHF